LTSNGQLAFDIIPTHLAVKAMRDNGYKNAASALGELIDNAIQAGASNVELLCHERTDFTSTRTVQRLNEIALIDNGSGMDSGLLRIALQFGNGSRLNDRSGMGRFGMGLPNSSVSQCKKVEVWTWQNGSKPIYTYLDLDEIVAGAMSEVPLPIKKDLPEFWSDIAETIGESGTLVVWSKLDRCTWKKANTLIKNSELLIGRMYRSFIQTGKVKIRMAGFANDGRQPMNDLDDLAVPNDPGYLISPSSTPAPWDDDAMFSAYGPLSEETIPVTFDGQVLDVTVRRSVAKKEARPTRNSGQLAHGRHAGNNTGISIVRAGRELTLDLGYVNRYDPTERWWGIEIEFPPGLDEIFGVSNDKQEARYFSDLSRLKINDLAKQLKMTKLEFQDYLRDEEDPLAALVDLGLIIENTIANLRTDVENTARVPGKKRFDPKSAEAIATKATRDRQDDGYEGRSDSAEALTVSQRVSEFSVSLEGDGYTPEEAKSLAENTLNINSKYLFTSRDVDSTAFFTISTRAGVVHVTLNTNHPAHKHLIEALDNDLDLNANQQDVESLNKRLELASVGLKLVLEAWARYEDESSGSALEAAREARADWGRMARRFLEGMG